MGEIENRIARSTQFCPDCGSAGVSRVTTTTMVVYLRCQDCAHIWSIPDRRRIPRADTQHPGADARDASGFSKA